MNATTIATTTNLGTCAPGTVLPFESINCPGCYICNWSGHLIRVPENGIAPGRPTIYNILGNEQLFVTMISPNPFVPVTKARLLAANFNVATNF